MYLSVSMREKIRDYETILVLFFLVIDVYEFYSIYCYYIAFVNNESIILINFLKIKHP